MKQIIAAVRNNDDVSEALKSDCKIIFLLNSTILTISEAVENAHKANAKLFVHFDFIEGLGKDKCGMKYLKSLGIDGIISVKANVIKMAHEAGLKSVQRFFIIDSRSAETANETIHSVKPDIVEVMPGIVCKVIKKLSKNGVPVIAGGLIENEQEVKNAIAAGASAVSTGAKHLWR